MERGADMGVIPILPRDRFHLERESGSYSCSYLPESSLPLSYMSDYSVVGLLVDDFPRAIEALEGAGIDLVRATLEQKTVTMGSRHFLRAVQLLRESGVRHDVTDVVYGLYQG
jgi:hypothetical protein